MKEQNLNIRYMVAQLSELSQQEQELVNRAKAATSNAYANYSHFYVGAALLLGDGRIVIGANQENAAFPSGLCAERSAIFGAQSNYPDQPILTLAIAARNGNGFLKSPISPCGACRQVMREFASLDIPVILTTVEDGLEEEFTLGDLLPRSFGPEDLNRK